MFFGMQDTENYGKYDTKTGKWISGQDNAASIRVDDLDDALLYMYPGGGQAPLTALMNKISKKKPCRSPVVIWYTKTFPKQEGKITRVYRDSAMTEPYVGGGRPEDPVYLHVPSDTAQYIRPGHQVLMRCTSDPRLDVTGKVINCTVNSLNSTVGVRLLEADDNAPAVPATGQTATTLAQSDHLLIIGNVNPEGSGWPLSIWQQPEEWRNHTQIFINPSEITRTASQTQTIFANDGGRADNLKETLLLHSVEKEKAFLWGQLSMRFGDNGKPERTMMGLIAAIKRGGWVSDYRWEPDPLVAGRTWQEGWYTWFSLMLDRIFSYGVSQERLAFCGSRAWLHIEQAIKNDPGSHFHWDVTTKAYGIRVVELMTVRGTVYLAPHPLFMYNEVDRNSMVIFDPKNMLTYKPLQDTTLVGKSDLKALYGDSNNRYWTDSFIEGYLTECTLKFEHPITAAYMTGFGYDNSLTP